MFYAKEALIIFFLNIQLVKVFLWRFLDRTHWSEPTIYVH